MDNHANGNGATPVLNGAGGGAPTPSLPPGWSTPGASGADGLSSLLLNSDPNRLDSFVNRLRDLTANAIYSQRLWLRNQLTERRDINKECDYPDLGAYDAWRYHDLYRQEAIANRVVGVMPEETWKVLPEVYEDDDPGEETEFELAFKQVAQGLRGGSRYKDDVNNPIWKVLKRLDVISGIGQYGILLMGFDDVNDDGTLRPLSEPVQGVEERFSMPGSKPPTARKGGDGKELEYGPQGPIGPEGYSPGTKAQPTGNYAGVSVGGEPRLGVYGLTVNKRKTEDRKLLYLKTFPESLAQISQWETNPTSPRYGQPVMYSVSFNDPRGYATGIGPPLSTMDVHWTRVLHVADNVESIEALGVPRMQPVLRRLLDLQKEYGGSAEGFWQGCIPGIKIETNPQLGANVVIPKAETKDALEQYLNGFQRFLIGEGTQINTLAPTIVDPTAQINIQIQAVCICLKVPQRIFMGSERGELSSSQDSREWTGRVKERQEGYVSDGIISPFIDRLIMTGVLPEPESYAIAWPDLASMTDAEKAAVGVQRVQALTTFISGGGDVGMTWMDFWTRFMGLDQAEAESIIDAVREAHSGEGDEDQSTGRSPLLATVGGAQALVALYTAAAQGAMSHDQLRAALYTLFQLSDDELDALAAEGEPAPAAQQMEAQTQLPVDQGGAEEPSDAFLAQQEAPEEKEPGPPTPVKVKSGESLVHPETGEEIATGPAANVGTVNDDAQRREMLRPRGPYERAAATNSSPRRISLWDEVIVDVGSGQPLTNAAKVKLAGGRWVTRDDGGHSYVRDGSVVAFGWGDKS